VSAALAPPRELAPSPALWKVVALLGVLVPLSLALLIASDGSLALAVAPLAVLGGLTYLVRGRVRTTALLLLLGGLMLEVPGERPAAGLWRSPLYPLGAFLLGKLNNLTGFGALRFTGLDVLAAALGAVIIYRRTHGDTRDAEGQVETAPVLARAGLITLGTLLGLWGLGVATGGDFQNSLWQVQKVLYLPILFFLFQAAFLGPRDHAVLARIVVGAALWKAATGLWVKATIAATEKQMPYVNTHSDSVLFTAGCVILIAAYMLGPTPARLVRCLVLVPPLLMGMVANNRRLAWVELGVALVTLLVMMPRNRFKRAMLRGLVVATPIFVLYAAAGWNSGSAAFKPAAMLRSMVESKSDSSSLSRDVENFNLVMTLAQNLVLGPGFGHEYVETMKGDDISDVFPQYRFIPHNSLLGLWAFGGMLGFIGFSALIVCGIFLGARSFRAARTHGDRVAAFVALSVVAVYLIQAYGDMGAFSWLATFLAAASLAVLGKLAVAVGAWPGRPRPALSSTA
jgi:hypothetical protein